MAQQLQVDRFRLSRLFQTHWGLPPHAWLVQWRLLGIAIVGDKKALRKLTAKLALFS